MRANVPAAFRVVNCRTKQLRPGQFAEITVRVGKGSERRRHADRLIADIVDVAFENKAVSVTCFALDQILPHIRSYSGWRGGVKIVVGMQLLRWEIGGETSEAGNSTHHGVNNGLNQ